MSKVDSVYQSLCREISAAIGEGRSQLPPERELCSRWDVSRQTLRRALALLKEEHFLVSRQGSGYSLTGLSPESGNQIAILMPDTESYLYPSIITGITRFFSDRHYQVSVISTGYDLRAEENALRRLLAQPPRGLFVFCGHSALPTPWADLYNRLEQSGVRMIFPEGRCPNLSCGAIAVDHSEDGAFALTRYLLEMGHICIGALMIARDLPGQARYLGWAKALAGASAPLRASQVAWLSPDQIARMRKDHSDRLMQEVLSGFPEDMTALICQSDELAFMAIRALERMHCPVPGAVSVAGIDGSYLRNTGKKALTTVKNDGGWPAACELMQMLLLGQKPLPKKPVWTVVPGDTCAPPGGSSRLRPASGT